MHAGGGWAPRAPPSQPHPNQICARTAPWLTEPLRQGGRQGNQGSDGPQQGRGTSDLRAIARPAAPLLTSSTVPTPATSTTRHQSAVDSLPRLWPVAAPMVVDVMSLGPAPGTGGSTCARWEEAAGAHGRVRPAAARSGPSACRPPPRASTPPHKHFASAAGRPGGVEPLGNNPQRRAFPPTNTPGAALRGPSPEWQAERMRGHGQEAHYGHADSTVQSAGE